jgi:flagellar protein FliT
MLSKDPSNTILALYAAIAQQSEHMLSAAQSNNWEELHHAEQQCSALIHQLQSAQQDAAPVINTTERQAHIAYLKKILADDAAIREITEPRLKQLEEFLCAATNNRKLSNHYDAD